jgi:hypothetical protein
MKRITNQMETENQNENTLIDNDYEEAINKAGGFG